MPLIQKWDQSTISHDNFVEVLSPNPSFCDTASICKAEAEDSLWDYFDFTETVREVSTGLRENCGFIIGRLNCNDTNRTVIYSSSEHPIQAQRPKLVIEYEETAVSEVLSAAQKRFTLNFSNNKLSFTVNTPEKVQVVLSNIRGRVVNSSIATGQSEQIISTAHLSPGIYFLTIPELNVTRRFAID